MNYCNFIFFLFLNFVFLHWLTLCTNSYLQIPSDCSAGLCCIYIPESLAVYT